jgi:hypothetical protein
MTNDERLANGNAPPRSSVGDHERELSRCDASDDETETETEPGPRGGDDQ